MTTVNWITTDRACALLWCLASPDEDDRDLYCSPWMIGADAIVTDGRFLLRLDGVTLDIGVPSGDFPTVVAKLLDPARYEPAGTTTLSALAEWSGPLNPHWNDDTERILPGSIGGVLLDRRLCARPLSRLVAEHDRLLRCGEFVSHILVAIHTQADKVLLVGEGFALVVMAVMAQPDSPPVAAEHVLSLEKSP